MKKFITTRYNIQSNKLHKTWNNKKIVILSDLHNNSYNIDMDKLMKVIREEKPEFMIMAGDMYSGDPKCDNKKAKKFLIEAASEFDIYYGLGNHEHRMDIFRETYPGMYDDFMDVINKTKIKLLINDSITVGCEGQEICIYGSAIDRSFYRKFGTTYMADEYMNSIVGKPDEQKFNILIAHHPDYFAQYACWGADLVVAGHYHGGMARLPFVGGIIAPNYRPFPRYDRGLYTIDDSTMILSAGIGTHTINIRPFNPAEVIVVTFNQDECLQ